MGRIRLRHLGSGRLLTVVTPPGWGAPSEAGTDRSGRALESQRGAGTTVKLLGAVAPLRDSNVSARSQEQPAQPQDVNLVVLADEDRIEPEDAAFGLEPQYLDDDGHLSFNKSFRLYHIKTGCYPLDADAAVNWQEEEAAAKERLFSLCRPAPSGQPSVTDVAGRHWGSLRRRESEAREASLSRTRATRRVCRWSRARASPTRTSSDCCRSTRRRSTISRTARPQCSASNPHRPVRGAVALHAARSRLQERDGDDHRPDLFVTISDILDPILR